MSRFREFFLQKKYKKIRKDQWLILFLAGVLLLVLAIPSGKTESLDGKDREETPGTLQQRDLCSSDYGRQLESRLEGMLSGMNGVGQVRVMLTFRDNGESVTEKDVQLVTEEEMAQAEQQVMKKHTQSTEQTVYDEGEQKGAPFIRVRKTPAVEGVLVVAECSPRSGAASDISEAIQALFGLDAHKIKIVEMNAVQEGS